MLNLVYKDFLLQRGSKSFIYMFVMPVVSAFAFSSDLLYVILPYIAGSYLYIVYANALDDKYKSEKMFISMPVGRNSIVGAKYLGVMFYMLAFLAAIGLLSTLISIVIPQFASIPRLGWSHIVQFIIVAALYYGIFFPLYFRVGYQRSRWANYISMILSAGLYAAATKGLSGLTGLDITGLQGALKYLTGISEGIWNGVLPLISAVIIAVSFYLSTVFYRKREF